MALLQKIKPSAAENNEEEWLGTYADAITLILCFFITIVAISKVDLPKLEQMKSGIQQELGRRDTQRPIASLEAAVEQVLVDAGISNDVSIRTDFIGVVVEFPSSQMFNGDTHVLTPTSASILNELTANLNRPVYGLYEVEIESHASTQTPLSGPYPTHWELTVMRAANIARAFEYNGVDARRLKAVGMGIARPYVPAEVVEIEKDSIETDPTQVQDQQQETDKKIKDIGDDRLVLYVHPMLDEKGNILEEFR